VTTVLAVRDLSARYGAREIFHGLSVQLDAGQSLGVIGPNGAGKTTLLRMLVGLITPPGGDSAGDVRIHGAPPREALRWTPVAYFAGDVTLPGAVRASAWGTLGTGAAITPERRRIRALSRGSRQLLGLRTALGRHPLGLIVLDEPWEALDPDTTRWLTTTIETKRDRGAAVVLASDRLQDLAGLCDLYLFLVGGQPTLLKAQEITSVGPVTPALLTDMFDKLRGGPPSLRIAS
jgi:ABC-type multidrug transport system ATPase subunit